ncbi:hypothetical protein C0416_00160 [bacterium]|nr:hypothetical protein [bacterium]
MKSPLALPVITKSIHGFIYSMFWVFVPVFLVQQRFSGFEIGVFIGLANLMAIVTTLPAGIANDRIHSKRMILYALIISMFYYLGLLTVTNSILLAGAFICGGLGKNLFNVSIDSMTFKVIDKKRSPIQLGKYLGYVILIEALGFMTGGYMISSFGFESTISIIIILLFIAVFISLFLPITYTFSFKLLEYKKDILQKGVLLFILVVFLFTFHYGAETTSYSLFLKDQFSLNSGQIGLFVGGSVFFVGLSSLFFGKKVAGGFNPRYVFYIGLFISGIGHVLLSLQTNVWFAFAVRCFHEFGDGAMIFSIYYGIVSIFNIERIGGNASIITFAQIMGASLSAFLFGPLGEHYGYYLPLFVSGITTILAGFILYIFDLKTKRTS